MEDSSWEGPSEGRRREGHHCQFCSVIGAGSAPMGWAEWAPPRPCRARLAPGRWRTRVQGVPTAASTHAAASAAPSAPSAACTPPRAFRVRVKTCDGHPVRPLCRLHSTQSLQGTSQDLRWKSRPPPLPPAFLPEPSKYESRLAKEVDSPPADALSREICQVQNRSV